MLMNFTKNIHGLQISKKKSNKLYDLRKQKLCITMCKLHNNVFYTNRYGRPEWSYTEDCTELEVEYDDIRLGMLR